MEQKKYMFCSNVSQIFFFYNSSQDTSNIFSFPPSLIFKKIINYFFGLFHWESPSVISKIWHKEILQKSMTKSRAYVVCRKGLLIKLRIW